MWIKDINCKAMAPGNDVQVFSFVFHDAGIAYLHMFDIRGSVVMKTCIFMAYDM
jgi:hypothetical protein